MQPIIMYRSIVCVRPTMAETGDQEMEVTEATIDRPEELARLISEAQKQPGLPEVLAVYEEWRLVEQIAEPVRQAMEPAGTIYTSNSSCGNAAQLA